MSKPPPMKRRVYIATKDKERLTAFACLGDDFLFTEEVEKAEFIVLDCVQPEPLNEWQAAAQPSLMIWEPRYPPIILAELGGSWDQGLTDKLTWDFGDVKLPRCTTPEALLETLLEIQTALPFYNQLNLEQLRQRVHEASAELSRKEESTK